MKTFYRIANTDTNQGLWYNIDGAFTGLIHNQFDFCALHQLPMPFDKNISGYLSATETLDELFDWFPVDDIIRLSEHGYLATVYKAVDYKFYNNHWLINQSSSIITNRISIPSTNQNEMFQHPHLLNEKSPTTEVAED